MCFRLFSCSYFAALHGNPRDAAIQINSRPIRKIFLLSRNAVGSTSFRDSRRLPCYRWNPWLRWLTPGLLQSVRGAPSSPPATPIPRWGGGGRLHPAFCQSWNLDRTFPCHGEAKQYEAIRLLRGPHLVMTVNYDSWKSSGLNGLGVRCSDISSCDEVQIDANLVVSALDSRWTHSYCPKSLIQPTQHKVAHVFCLSIEVLIKHRSWWWASWS